MQKTSYNLPHASDAIFNFSFIMNAADVSTWQLFAYRVFGTIYYILMHLKDKRTVRSNLEMSGNHVFTFYMFRVNL